MSTDADESDGETVKLNVKVPKRLLNETEPVLTPAARERVSEGYSDVAAGRTMSTEEARERLGIDDS